MDLFILILVIGIALIFDYTNGFHDTANMVSTSISTRALSPRIAVAMTAILNFVGAFLSIKVAETIGSGIVASELVTQHVVLAALLGACAWNILTWLFGLPSSSSHALIGGLIGAMLASTGIVGIKIAPLIEKVALPAVMSVIVSFVLSILFILLVYRLFRNFRPMRATRIFRTCQIPASALLSIAHGMNDAQKTMGVITLSLVAYGAISPDNFHVPLWVVVASASAIALGTYTGGWRIIKTVGTKIIKMNPAQGFVAQSSGSIVILVSSLLGYPLSTTHVMSSSIIGAGAARRLSAVRWGIAKNIIVAWILTIPCTMFVSFILYYLLALFMK